MAWWSEKLTNLIGTSRISITGLICIIFGIIINVWTPYEFMLNERLNMRPSLPPFKWWSYPPPVMLDVFIYNITNEERFLSGEDPKMIMEEVGPIFYREIWTHTNVVFNPNSTISYLVNKTAEYMEENTIDLNATLVVPNFATLAVVSQLWDSPIFTKMTVNAIFKILKKKHIVHTTVYNVLYNYTDSFLDALHNVLPTLVPERNLGIIPLVYKDYSDNVTAFIGSAHGNELFSLIDTYRNSHNIPGHSDKCKHKITNATEGIIYNQMLTKDSVPKYYRRGLCKTADLYYESEHTLYGLRAYKFAIAPSDLNRTYPPEDDCFDTKPSLPNGTADISKCVHSYPVTTSFIYFNHTDDSLKTCAKIKIPRGKTAPPSEVYLEPITGIPLKSSAALQANLNVKPLRGFDRSFDKFSGQQIPLFYLHYHGEGVPLKVFCMIYLMRALPAIGWILTVSLFAFGLYCIWKSVRRKPKKGKRKENTPSSESVKETNVELETFLKETVLN